MQPTDYPRRAEEAFNRRDFATLASLWAVDFHYTAPGEETRGRDAALARERALITAMPDVRADIARHFADGERLVIEGVLRGTHTGPLRLATGELPPTGRALTIHFVGVFSFAAGVAAAERVYYDRLDLMRQLGTVAP